MLKNILKKIKLISSSQEIENNKKTFVNGKFQEIEEKIYYHGTTIKNLEKLLIEKSRDNNPFGKAIYLTQDKEIAKCYGNIIYKVRIKGDFEYTINLDNKYDEHTEIIKSRLNYLIDESSFQDDVTRDVLYDGYGDYNKELRNIDIWMVYGHLHPISNGGKLDNGVQHALLDETKIISVKLVENI